MAHLKIGKKLYYQMSVDTATVTSTSASSEAANGNSSLNCAMENSNNNTNNSSQNDHNCQFKRYIFQMKKPKLTLCAILTDYKQEINFYSQSPAAVGSNDENDPYKLLNYQSWKKDVTSQCNWIDVLIYGEWQNDHDNLQIEILVNDENNLTEDVKQSINQVCINLIESLNVKYEWVIFDQRILCLDCCEIKFKVAEFEEHILKNHNNMDCTNNEWGLNSTNNNLMILSMKNETLNKFVVCKMKNLFSSTSVSSPCLLPNWTTSGLVICGPCETIFPSPFELDEHNKQQHNNNNNSNNNSNNSKIIRSNLSHNNGNNNIINTNNNSNSSSNNSASNNTREYRCNICNYRTVTKGNLHIHFQSEKHRNNQREHDQNEHQTRSSCFTGSQPTVPSQSPHNQHHHNSHHQQSRHHSSLSTNHSIESISKNAINTNGSTVNNLSSHINFLDNLLACQQQQQQQQQQQNNKKQFQPNEILIMKQLVAASSSLCSSPLNNNNNSNKSTSCNSINDNNNNNTINNNWPNNFSLPAVINKETVAMAAAAAACAVNNVNSNVTQPVEPLTVYECEVCHNFAHSDIEALLEHIDQPRALPSNSEISKIIRVSPNNSIINGSDTGNTNTTNTTSNSTNIPSNQGELEHVCLLDGYKTRIKANFLLHFKTEKHQQKLQLLAHAREGGQENANKLVLQMVTEPATSCSLVSVKCRLCRATFSTAHKLRLHVDSSDHQMNQKIVSSLQLWQKSMENNNTNITKPNNNNNNNMLDLNTATFECKPCGIIFNRYIDILEHFHAQKYNNLHIGFFKKDMDINNLVRIQQYKPESYPKISNPNSMAPNENSPFFQCNLCNDPVERKELRSHLKEIHKIQEHCLDDLISLADKFHASQIQTNKVNNKYNNLKVSEEPNDWCDCVIIKEIENTTDSLVRCQQCGRCFSTIPLLEEHRQNTNHHEIFDSRGHLCFKKGCNQYFKTQNLMIDHFYEIHASQISEYKRLDNFKYICKICHLLAFSCPDKYNEHFNLHCNVGVCVLCGHVTETRTDLRNHLEKFHIIHDEKENKDENELFNIDKNSGKQSNFEILDDGNMDESTSESNNINGKINSDSEISITSENPSQNAVSSISQLWSSISSLVQTVGLENLKLVIETMINSRANNETTNSSENCDNEADNKNNYIGNGSLWKFAESLINSANIRDSLVERCQECGQGFSSTAILERHYKMCPVASGKTSPRCVAEFEEAVSICREHLSKVMTMANISSNNNKNNTCINKPIYPEIDKIIPNLLNIQPSIFDPSSMPLNLRHSMTNTNSIIRDDHLNFMIPSKLPVPNFMHHIPRASHHLLQPLLNPYRFHNIPSQGQSIPPPPPPHIPSNPTHQTATSLSHTSPYFSIPPLGAFPHLRLPPAPINFNQPPNLHRTHPTFLHSPPAQSISSTDYQQKPQEIIHSPPVKSQNNNTTNINSSNNAAHQPNQTQSNITNNETTNRKRTQIKNYQYEILRSYFNINNPPNDEIISEIITKTGLDRKTVKHWFRNTLFKERQKCKDSPYNFSIPPETSLDLEEYEKTGKIEIKNRIIDVNSSKNICKKEELDDAILPPPRKREKLDTSSESGSNLPSLIKHEPMEPDNTSIREGEEEYEYDEGDDEECNVNVNIPIRIKLPDQDETPLDLSYCQQPIAAINNSNNCPNSTAANSNSVIGTSFTLDPISPFEGSTEEPELNENSNSNNGERRHRTTLTAMQIQAMKSIFIHCRSPSHGELAALGTVLSLDMRVVQVWFQNQRAKLKKQERNYENHHSILPNHHNHHRSHSSNITSGGSVTNSSLSSSSPALFPEAIPSIVELSANNDTTNPTSNMDYFNETTATSTTNPSGPSSASLASFHCLVCGLNLPIATTKQSHLFSHSHLTMLMRYLVTKTNDFKINWKSALDSNQM